MNLAVVILAAGASTRMGKPKMLLPWGATSVIGHLIEQWNALRALQIAVVHASSDTPLIHELDRLNVPSHGRIPNPNPELGMFSSIQCAANWTGWVNGLTRAAITLGDQPHLQSDTLSRLIGFSEKHPAKICQPSCNQRPKHPVILPYRTFQTLANCQEKTLAEFLRNRPDGISLVEIEDPGLNLDLDHPSDYDQALRSAGV